MEILSVVFSILAVSLSVIALTTMVLDSAHRSSLIDAMKKEKKDFEEAVVGLRDAHANVVKGMNETIDKIETMELQIKSLTIGTQAPRRGF